MSTPSPHCMSRERLPHGRDFSTAAPFIPAMKKKANKEMRMSDARWAKLPKTLTYFTHIIVEEGLILAGLTQFEENPPIQRYDIFNSNGQ